MFVERNNYLKQLEKEAENAFANFEGYDNFDEDFYEEDFDEEFDEDYDEEYDDELSYNGIPAGKLTVSDKILPIVINNTNATAVDVPVFGAYKNKNATNFNIPAGVTVTCPNSSYAQVLEEISANPMLVKGIKMQVSNAAQFASQVVFIKRESTGSEERDPLTPLHYLRAEQQQGTIIEMPGIKFPLDGKVEMLTNVLPNVTATFIFTIAAKVDITRITEGKSAIKVAPRRKKPKRRGWLPTHRNRK